MRLRKVIISVLLGCFIKIVSGWNIFEEDNYPKDITNNKIVFNKDNINEVKGSNEPILVHLGCKSTPNGIKILKRVYRIVSVNNSKIHTFNDIYSDTNEINEFNLVNSEVFSGKYTPIDLFKYKLVEIESITIEKGYKDGGTILDVLEEKQIKSEIHIYIEYDEKANSKYIYEYLLNGSREEYDLKLKSVLFNRVDKKSIQILSSSMRYTMEYRENNMIVIANSDISVLSRVHRRHFFKGYKSTVVLIGNYPRLALPVEDIHSLQLKVLDVSRVLQNDIFSYRITTQIINTLVGTSTNDKLMEEIILKLDQLVSLIRAQTSERRYLYTERMSITDIHQDNTMYSQIDSIKRLNMEVSFGNITRHLRINGIFTDRLFIDEEITKDLILFLSYLNCTDIDDVIFNLKIKDNNEGCSIGTNTAVIDKNRKYFFSIELPEDQIRRVNTKICFCTYSQDQLHPSIPLSWSHGKVYPVRIWPSKEIKPNSCCFILESTLYKELIQADNIVDQYKTIDKYKDMLYRLENIRRNMTNLQYGCNNCTYQKINDSSSLSECNELDRSSKEKIEEIKEIEEIEDIEISQKVSKRYPNEDIFNNRYLVIHPIYGIKCLNCLFDLCYFRPQTRKGINSIKLAFAEQILMAEIVLKANNELTLDFKGKDISQLLKEYHNSIQIPYIVLSAAKKK
ncbi:hypothetical protein NEOKW01_0356 [Nematocida sp. AWRm80]|nr:hypothetical protein NEOKW01_0356 [Nematocida sp. AWRm80]